MKKPNTIAKQKERLTKRAQNLIPLEVWLINNEEARQLHKEFVKQLNERYNCFKFNNGDKND